MTDMDNVIQISYAPFLLVDRPTLRYITMIELPRDGYGKGYEQPPELNKIYDPKRPRYPGWWVHMFIKDVSEVDAAARSIIEYLHKYYGVDVEWQN